MIQLTRLNGHPFILNAELIKFIEQTPDTLVTLRDGDKLMVLESADEVVRRAMDFRRAVRWIPNDSVVF
jgi:flagellar protein FlbD